MTDVATNQAEAPVAEATPEAPAASEASTTVATVGGEVVVAATAPDLTQPEAEAETLAMLGLFQQGQRIAVEVADRLQVFVSRRGYVALGYNTAEDWSTARLGIKRARLYAVLNSARTRQVAAALGISDATLKSLSDRDVRAIGGENAVRKMLVAGHSVEAVKAEAAKRRADAASREAKQSAEKIAAQAEAVAQASTEATTDAEERTEALAGNIIVASLDAALRQIGDVPADALGNLSTEAVAGLVATLSLLISSGRIGAEDREAIEHSLTRSASAAKARKGGIAPAKHPRGQGTVAAA